MEKLFDFAAAAHERALADGREPRRWNVRSDALAQLAQEASEYRPWDRAATVTMFGIPVIDVGPEAKLAGEFVTISYQD